MQLASGTRLGPYEILAPLGAGGMGEVYKARDTRLERTVAIKILPPHVVADPGLRARFEREARAVSSLDHPNICVVHDVGRDGDVEYLVMQYLEGETLAARLARGPLPLPEALRYGIDIAGALDRAHRAGILHRDIKPANVMLVKSAGRDLCAKLLDFGLAKVVESGGAGATLGGPATATSPLTGRGTILGTLLYMSPEQLEGGEVDARSDIFSFGAMLYETITGRRAFDGASPASIIAAVLERDPPPIVATAPLTPPALDRVVRKCLAKDRERRWQSAADLRDELSWVAESTSIGALPVTAARPAPARRHWLPLLLGAALAIVGFAAAAAAVVMWPRGAPSNELARDLGVTLPDGVRITRGGIAVSPDGRSFVFVASAAPVALAAPAMASTGATSQLYLRRFDSSEVTPIPGTEGARAPFFSFDGQSVAYFTNSALMKVSLRGGRPARVSGMPPVTRGGAWLPDDSMVVAPTQTTALLQVATDGSSKPLTTLDAAQGENAHLWPSVLPGGQDVLFTIRRGTTSDVDAADIGLLHVATGERHILIKGGTFARYSPTGHLLFLRSGTLSALAFDLSTKQVHGAPVPILPGIAVDPWIGGGHYAVTPDGTLIVLRGTFGEDRVAPVWANRQGTTVPAAGITGRLPNQPRISPDGLRALFDSPSPVGDDEVYLADLARGTVVRFSDDPEDDFDAVWTADGRQVIWTALPPGRLPYLVMRGVDGRGSTQELVKEDTAQFSGSVSPQRVLAYTRASPGGASDVYTLPLDGDRKPRPFVNTAAVEFGPEFSPDGKWIAYVSDESGVDEVYVAPYPGPGGRQQVTGHGGASPAWSHAGRELFYQSSEGLFAVSVGPNGPELQFGEPHRILENRFVMDARQDGPRAFDVAPDGTRFLMFVPDLAKGPAPVMHVLLNWAASLKQESSSRR